METLLLKNDAGQSVLHMLVNRTSTFYHIKALLGAIDEHLSIQSPGRDTSDVKSLLETYRFHINQFDRMRQPIVIHPMKMAVLDQPESLSGRTPLLLALKQEALSTVLMLLAHYANPMVADRSGVDCALLVKDENRYKHVYVYVMKAFCLKNLLRASDKGCKRRYIKRADIDVSADLGLEEASTPKIVKKSN